MAIIHAYNGGEPHRLNGRPIRGPMFPRPEPLFSDKSANQVAYEKHGSGISLSRRLDTCECGVGSDGCACKWGVDDEFGVLLLPTCYVIEGYSVEVINGIDGLLFDLRSYNVTDGTVVGYEGRGLVPVLPKIATGLSASPIAGMVAIPPPVPPAAAGVPVQTEEDDCDPDEPGGGTDGGPGVDTSDGALGTCDKPILDCDPCDGFGGCQYFPVEPPTMVGGGMLQTQAYRQYLTIRIDTVPADFECGNCCLILNVTAFMKNVNMGS